MTAYPILVRSTPGGERRAPPVDIDVALTTSFAFDAHTVQYEGEHRRNKADVSPDNPLVLSIELYDFDYPQKVNGLAPDGWAEDCLSRLPPGFVGYRTAGGFRAGTLREPWCIVDGDSWEDWRQYHGGRAEALGALLGAAPDHATDEPNRLFRLPDAPRDDGKPIYPTIFGELDYATLAPAPWERRAATTQAADGAAARSLVGAAFTAAGRVIGEQGSKLIVDCPWIHEHTTPGGTFVDDTDDHHGHFVCGHSHCKAAGRGSAEALEALRGLPAVAAELLHWPEPGIGAWERVASPPCPLVVDSESKRPAPGSIWLTGAALAAPVSDVDWLVRGLELAPGRCPIIAADSGSGKSWSVQSIALSVATGQDVFGRFPCRQGPVFHIAEDSDINAVLDRYQRLARGMRVDLAALDLAIYSPRFRVTGARGVYDPKPLAAVLDTAAKNSAALVIIDSLATVCVGLEENSPEIAQPLYDSRHGSVTVLWTHHTNRGSETYRGSSALKAAAGAMWGVSGRDDEPRSWKNEKHAERTAAKERLEGFETTWDGERILFAEPADTSHEERPADRMSKEILQVMERSGVSSKTAILELVGGSKPLKTRVFDFLVYSRVIEHAGSRYTRAVGVPVPRLPDEAAREVFSRSNAHRKTQ